MILYQSPATMKFQFLLFFVLGCNLSVYTQNLIPNNSFEETDSIFKTGIKYWISFPPYAAKFIEKESDDIPPFDGITQVKLTLSAHTKKYGSPIFVSQNKGYLLTRLMEPLKKGRIYKFSISARVASTSLYATNKINVYLAKTPNKNLFPIKPNLIVARKNGKFITNQRKWMTYFGYYRAKGGEKYIVIGNNKTNNTTKIIHPHLMKADTSKKGTSYTHMDYSAKLVYYFDHIQLEPIATYDFPIGKSFIFESLLFPTGNATIPSSAHNKLQELVKLFKTHNDLKLKIEGHTDNVGSTAYNLNLAKARADEVKKYLIQNGINPSRVKSKGIGASDPAFANDNPSGQAKNRRVVLLIVTN